MSPRVWLITGASSGFGRAIAEAALSAGDVVVAAVRRLDSVADLVAAEPDRVTTVQLDITDHARISAAVDEVLARHGRIDVLVNNAGRGLAGAAEQVGDKELRGLMDLHFFGPVELTRAVLPHMRERRDGTIVQMSSQAGRYSFAGISGYSATKFALEGWSEGVAPEVAPFGIRVLIVEPGAFRTSFNEPGVLLTENNETYQDTVGPVLSALAGANGVQPGDPVKAAAAILSAVDAKEPPLRLPLGNDAVDSIAASLKGSRVEIFEWESLARSTDFPA
ncbi:oxidoreductase [Amycolatopsis sp. H20-H5]|uniref:oxidoreductase n=1 Tax=Amycolatopsis sp. H20-H5 TaxID=3046309 RepID=UPI002DBA8B18|nr:oxidoreductase [Amycolatopsis sp. H20-H5]MEC3977376.1 oxidoreductase [Amycolatopsis sp. H20-H5]